jgi:hypothetical protein
MYSTDESYDRINNPDRLSVSELSPMGISWCYNSQCYEITNERRVSALFLKDETGIVVVEAPFDHSNNKAYIINAKGEIVWNVKDLFHAKYKDFINGYYVSFYYPIYESSGLYFHITMNNLEYRFLFDILTGDIGHIIESR